MFIISTRDGGAASIAAFLDASGLSNRVHVLRLGSFHLAWAAARPQDNLHIFRDGAVIGKLGFSEPARPDPWMHDSVTPSSLHPLLHSTIVNAGSELVIRPAEQQVIYFSKQSVSDFQLLVARHDGFAPGLMGTALLGIVGYFPSGLTLFDDVRSVPYLDALTFPSNRLHRFASFDPKPANDNRLIERLVDITPLHNPSAVALSGGLDSRFVLGVLLRKGVRPRAYTLAGVENQIAEAVCATLGLELKAGHQPRLEDDVYALRTDGRIYHQGSNLRALLVDPRPEEVLHNGLWSDPIIENALKSAWKKPGSRKTIYEDLIWLALLAKAPASISGYVRPITRQDLFDFLREKLAHGKTYADFRTRKEWAAWFYHIHRGVNWTNAAMADTSFEVYPVYLLADRIATEYGITASAYSNFYKERLRRLNRVLLPAVRVDYSDGRSFRSKPPIVRDIHKLAYEFGHRAIVRTRGIRKVQAPGESIAAWAETETHPALGNYFSQPLPGLMQAPSVTRNVKRAALTVNSVLKFLMPSSSTASAGQGRV